MSYDGVVSVILFESASCCMSPDFLCYVSMLQFCVTLVYYGVVVRYPIFTAVLRYKVECISLIYYVFVVQMVM